jgi:hypothetical protein
VSTRFPIWIDAICINQQDNEEKDHQVQHMGEIYRNAKLVVVWLGPSKDNSNLAMQSIPALSRTMRTIPFEIPNTELHSYDLPRERNPIWLALGYLFQREWFRRLWTFQEVALAKEILFVCGRKTVEWDPFASAAEELYRLGLIRMCLNYQGLEVYEDGFASIINLSIARRALVAPAEYGVPHTTYILGILDQKQVTDPRDKIYGMLGLVEKALREAIPISYDSDQTEGAFKAYTDCAKACIKEESPCYLQILQLVSGRARDLKLPTWVPNFMSTRGVLRAFGDHLHAGQIPGQSMPRSAKIKSNILYLAGFCVDIVAEVIEEDFPFSGHPEDLISMNRKLLEWEANCLELARRTYRDSPQSEVTDGIPLGHLFTLTSNTRARASEADDEKLLHAYQDNLLHTRSVAEERKNRSPRPGSKNSFYEVWSQIVHACGGRQYFSTEGGRTGLGPPEIMAGDTVCVIYDAQTLFLLRPMVKEDGEEGWFFVGDAYVYGMMDLRETLKGKRGEDQIFKIF